MTKKRIRRDSGSYLWIKNNFAFLDLNPTKEDLYQEVAICGYPQGDESFALLNNPSGLKLSPIIQFGHISGFMPYDDADIPYGIQTDIVGTGGSSGSPNVNTNGELLGITQRVLSAEVLNPLPDCRWKTRN
jgi:hypothetical protein